MPTKERRERAKKRAQEGTVTFKVPVETPGATDAPASVPAQDAEATASIDALLDSLPAKSEARISRYHPEEGKYVYVGVTSPSVISQKWVMENLGGGRYEIPLYKQGGEDRRLAYYKTITIDVDTQIPRKIPPWARPAPTEAAIATGPVHAPGGSNIIDAGVLQLFTAMQQTSQMQGQMMQAFIERMANQPQTDWVAVLAALGPVGAALLKMVTDRKDPAAIAAELLERFKPARQEPAPTGAVAEAFGLFDRFLSIQNKLTPRGAAAAPAETDDSLVGFLKTAFPEVLATFRETLAARRQAAALAAGRPPAPPNGNGAAPGTPTVPGPTMTAAAPPAIAAVTAAASPSASAPPAVPPAAASTPVDPNAPPWVPFVRPWIPHLVQWLAADYYPETVADLLLKAIDKEGRLQIAESMLIDVGFPAALLSYFPPLGPHAQALGEVFEAVREDLSPDDDGGEPIGEEETA
jgi:hypothetical protein